MGNTKRFVLTGAAREKFDEEFLADVFRTSPRNVALTIYLGPTGASWFFIAAVQSNAMSATDGIWQLRERCIDLSAVTHDADWPGATFDRFEPAGERHEQYELRARETTYKKTP